jgi:hypothetical protein
VLLGLVGKTVEVRGGACGERRRTLGLGQRRAKAKKKSIALITMLVKYVPPKVR